MNSKHDLHLGARPMTGELPGPPPPPGPVPDRPVRPPETIRANFTTYAAPALREIAARAAELAAMAGEAAGPLAHKAAEVTEGIGGRVADKGHRIATDLRREAAGATTSSDAGAAPGAADLQPPAFPHTAFDEPPHG